MNIESDNNLATNKTILIEYYYIDNINFQSNSINYIKLFDKNGIKVNIDHYIKNGFFSSSLLDEFYFKRANITLLPKEESEKILKEHLAAASEVNDYNQKNNNIDKSVLKIYYSLTENIEYDNPNEFAYRQNIHTNFFLRKTSLSQPRKYNIEKISPENLSFLIDEYSIENNPEGLISDIRNKSDNLKVLFLAEEVKAEDNDNTSTFANYDKLPIGLNLYYSLHKNHLNILHLDFIDAQLRNVKNVEVINYNFARASQGNINNPSSSNSNLLIPQNVNAFKVKKFEEELLTNFFECEAADKKGVGDDDTLVIIIRNLKTRRVVLRKKTGGDLIYFRSQDFNLKKDNYCKIFSFNESYQKKLLEKQSVQSHYIGCIAKITNIPVNKIIDVKYFNINNFQAAATNNIDNNSDNNNKKTDIYKTNNSGSEKIAADKSNLLNEVIQDKNILMPEQSEFENKNSKNEKLIMCENVNNDEDSSLIEPNKDLKFTLNLNKSEFFNNRSFIDAQLVFDANENYIDLLSSNSNNMFFFLEKDLNICVTPCLLGKLEPNKELDLGKIQMEKEQKQNAEEIGLLKKIKSNFEYYSMYFTDNYNAVNDLFLSLPAEEKAKFNKSITEDLQSMNKISFYIESKELWEYIEVRDYIIFFNCI